jgi:hypothetical protein
MKRALLTIAFIATAHAQTEDTGWRVQVSAPKTAKVGAHGLMEVTVETRAGYHLNDDYPLNFKPAGTAQVTFDAAKIEKANATLSPCNGGEHACRAKVPVGFSAKTDGTLKLTGTLAFSACNDANCLIEKIPVSADVIVTR